MWAGYERRWNREVQAHAAGAWNVAARIPTLSKSTKPPLYFDVLATFPRFPKRGY